MTKIIVVILIALSFFIRCSNDDSSNILSAEEGKSNSTQYIDGNILGKWVETEPFFDSEWCDTVTIADSGMFFSEDQWGSAKAVYGSDKRVFFAIDGWIGNTFSGVTNFKDIAMWSYEINSDTLSLRFLNGRERAETTVQYFVKQ